ncbi:hypothetical protein PQR36_34085, partial [Paraburkholderia nemoris]|uniref:hypothetical protein n=1 Tax=Paraburkholderia nemoris TaxID=2793076 RepID=UPI0038B9D657
MGTIGRITFRTSACEINGQAVAACVAWNLHLRAPGRRTHRDGVHVEQPSFGDSMSFVIVLAALAFLMFAAYRGYSVILF